MSAMDLYRVIRPIEGFCRNTGSEITVPPGAIVIPIGIPTVIGLLKVRWTTYSIWISADDFEASTVKARAPVTRAAVKGALFVVPRKRAGN